MKIFFFFFDNIQHEDFAIRGTPPVDQFEMLILLMMYTFVEPFRFWLASVTYPFLSQPKN